MITTALTIITYGTLLSVGFHVGKKVCNQADYLCYIHSKKYKKLVERLGRKDDQRRTNETGENLGAVL